MRTDDEIAAASQPRRKVAHDLHLQRRLKVGEHEIAAENKVERSFGYVPPDVLLQERDILAVRRLHAQQIVSPLEATIDPVARHLLHAAPLVAAGRRAGENRFVDIGTKQRKGDIGMSVGERQVPQDAQRIDLLARGAAGRPADNVALLLRRQLRQLWQDALAQDPEHISVAIEARDCDATEAVEDRPFLLVALQVVSVGGEVFQSEALHAAADALADLAADLAEAAPPEAELRQGPLQEGDAVRARQAGLPWAAAAATLGLTETSAGPPSRLSMRTFGDAELPDHPGVGFEVSRHPFTGACRRRASECERQERLIGQVKIEGGAASQMVQQCAGRLGGDGLRASCLGLQRR